MAIDMSQSQFSFNQPLASNQSNYEPADLPFIYQKAE